MTRAFSLSQQNLAPTMLIVGLFMVAFAGFVTWVFALYTSHYIAGPLYGFSRNFQLMLEQGKTTHTPMRKNDQLKREERHITRSIVRLQRHYEEMRTTTEAALSELDGMLRAPASSTTDKPLDQIVSTISKLKELDRAAHL